MSEEYSINLDQQQQIMRLQEERDYWKNTALTLQDIIELLQEASRNSILDLSDALMNADNDLLLSNPHQHLDK
jgi:hypothetical protein